MEALHWTRAAEFGLWALAFVVLEAWNRLLHFTWWGVFYHIATLAGAGDWNTDIGVQMIVITGVWFMSASGCSMLVDTESDMGTAAYMGGNFFVHYVPLLSAAARRPWRGGGGKPTALILWILYNAVAFERKTDPSEIYGCNVQREVTLTVGGVAATAAAVFTSELQECASQRSYAD